DVVVAERCQASARRIGERPIALDRHNLTCQPREYRRLIARAGANLEHPMLLPHTELPGHVSHQEWLADGLAASDRQRTVRISAVPEAAINEALARPLVEGAQHRHVVDAAPPQFEQELHAADAVFHVRFLGHACSLLMCFLWDPWMDIGDVARLAIS